MDHMHEKDSRLYQVMDNRHDKDGIHTMNETPSLLARTLKEEMPEVEYAAGVLATSWDGRGTLSVPHEAIKAVGHYADKGFFNAFSYPLFEGNTVGGLVGNNSLVQS